jgi:hypothetical protein
VGSGGCERLEGRGMMGAPGMAWAVRRSGWLWVAIGCLTLVGAAPAGAAQWSTKPMPVPSGPISSSLLAVSCSSSRACTAVGTSRLGALAEQWNGRRWRLQSTPPIDPHTEFPDLIELTDVSCSSTGACTAIGDDGLGPVTLRWNGRRWLRQRRSRGSELTPSSVSCGSASACVTVANDTECSDSSSSCVSSSEVQRWDGREWRLQQIPGPSSDNPVLEAVSCASARACLIVGYSDRGPLVERWDGRRWIKESAPTLRKEILVDVSCPSSNDCTAIGTFIPRGRAVWFAARWDGSKWTVHTISGPPGSRNVSLNDISCDSRRDCMMTGRYTSHFDAGVLFVAHWDGRRLRLTGIPAPRGGRKPVVNDVSCVPGRVCVGVGDFDNPARLPDAQQSTLVERWDRSRWAVQPSPNSNRLVKLSVYLNEVSCASRTSCTAVGSTDELTPPVVEHWDGSTWAIRKPPPGTNGDYFSSVSCPTLSECVAVGNRPSGNGPQALAVVMTTGHWSIAPLVAPRAFLSGLAAVSCASATDCIGVGWYELRANSVQISFSAHWNGTTWSSSTMPVPADAKSAGLTRVSCAAVTACTAVGAYIPSGSNASQLLVEVWNGSTWTIQTPPPPPDAISASFGGVSCWAGGVCTAVGTFRLPGGGGGPFAERSTGAHWSFQGVARVSTGNDFSADSCPSATDCVAVGFQAARPLAESWNGSTWSTEQTPAIPRRDSGELTGVSCVDTTTCIAVGILSFEGLEGDEMGQPYSEVRS